MARLREGKYLRRIETIKQGDKVIGTRVKVKVVKNKVAPPFRIAEFGIMFNSSISREGDLVDLGTKLEVIKKSGAFLSYGSTRLGQSRESVKGFLKQHPEITQEIE